MSTELFAAISQHDTARVRELLVGGANPNELQPPWPEVLPLQVAIWELSEGGELDVLQALLESGADVNAWDARHDRTPLLTAVGEDELAAVELLLKAGAEPNVKGGEGVSPLRLSAEMGSPRLAELLLAAGATRTINDWGGITARTALGHAARRLDLPMIRLLLKAGAAPRALDGDRRPAHLLLPPRDESNAQDWDVAFELLEGAKDRPPR